MTIPRTTLLVALLAAAVALTGAAAAPDSQAARPPGPAHTYLVTADLDGRMYPKKNGDVAAVDFLLKGQRVPIECQKSGGPAYGSKLWDLVTDGRKTLYVPDRFIKTGTDGRAPGVPRCTPQDFSDAGPAPGPFN